MRIKSMIATFGCLDRARLEPGEGFNLIQAPNEGGKSTWCAFLKAMFYGIDTRDRDRKGYLADKNRYQPWSGAYMEGEITLEWQGRDITIRRSQKGSTPLGAFSAVYTGTQEPVPGFTAETCGPLLLGVGREVYERSAFIGGSAMALTSVPELEKRIAALVSSGEEDVSFSQAQGKLREWLNRRKVNRSVGLIPKLEEELEQVNASLAALESVTADIARLEGEKNALEHQRVQLEEELEIHRRLAGRALNRRYAQASQELEEAQRQLSGLEADFGALPSQEQLKRAQGELQYLKVMDEEIRQGEEAMKEAEEAYVQAQIAAQDERFAGLSAEEAAARVQRDLAERAAAEKEAGTWSRMSRLFPAAGLAAMVAAGAFSLLERGTLLYAGFAIWLILLAVTIVVGLVNRSMARRCREKGARILARYGVSAPEEAEALAQDYRARCQAAEEAARRLKEVRGGLNDRKARRDNSWEDLLHFVHTFAPQAGGLFGCSAAISRALGMDHELALARERVEERRRRRDDLATQGGQAVDTLEALAEPERTPEESRRALAEAEGRLRQISQSLGQALGRQRSMGDPAALSARRERLEGELEQRKREYDALTLAMDALQRANVRLQERFSPELNRLSGLYLSRLTGERYTAVTLNRELEGAALRKEDVLPRSALALSRGTADQLYLAVRLAVCRLCLPEKPPVVLDDALVCFDDQRLALALDLLRELAAEQQLLLFTCQGRERAALEGAEGVTCLSL